jgi:hypothetical protein
MLSRTEQAKTYDLTGKPFTQALLSRASQYQDEARSAYRDREGIKPPAGNETLEQFAASCALTIVYYITVRSMKGIGRSPLMPSGPVPVDAPVFVAFGLSVLSGVYCRLAAEGIKLDFRDMTAQTLRIFFLLHRETERAKTAVDGLKTFQTLTAGDRNSVKKWQHNLLQLIPLFMMQWTTDNAKLKKIDFIPLFGSMLLSLLRMARSSSV